MQGGRCLEIEGKVRVNEKGLKQSGKTQRIRGEKRGKSGKSQGKVREFVKLSDYKSFAIPHVQLNDFSLCKNASPRKFSKVRGKSRNSQGK